MATSISSSSTASSAPPTASDPERDLEEERVRATEQFDADELDAMEENKVYDAWLEEHLFEGRFTEDADVERSLVGLKEKYTAIEKSVGDIQVPATGTADEKAALRDMLKKFGVEVPGFWEVLKEMGVDNPVDKVHGQLHKARQCLQGMQREIDAMSLKVDDLQRVSRLQESAPAASTTQVVTRDTADSSTQTDAEKPALVVITQPSAADQVQERMAKVGEFLSKRFIPHVLISDELCRDMSSILTLSTTGADVTGRLPHIRRWCTWAPTHAYAETARPTDAVDFLVLCHGDIQKMSYHAFHEVVLGIFEADDKNKKSALVTIDVALPTMLRKVRKLGVPNADLAFIALRAIELLLTCFPSPCDLSMLKKTFSTAAVNLRLDDLTDDLLIVGLRQYLERYFAGIDPKSPPSWILAHANETGRVLPPSKRGGPHYAAHKETVLVLPENLMSGKVSVFPVRMEVSEYGVFSLVLTNDKLLKEEHMRLELQQSHEAQYLKYFPRAVRALSDLVV